MNCQTALFSSLQGSASSFSYKGRRCEAEQTPNTEQLLPLYQCRPTPPGPKLWVWREPWLSLAPLPTLQCTPRLPFYSPASNRRGKGPAHAVISLGQRLLGSGVRLVPSRQFLPHTPQQGAFGVFLLNISRKGKYPAGGRAALFLGY